MNDALAGFINPFSGLNLAAAWNANGTTNSNYAGDWPTYPPPSAGVLAGNPGEVLVTDGGARFSFD